MTQVPVKDKPRQALSSFFRASLLTGLVIFLLLTNRWLDWSTGIKFLSANDILAYQQIAETSPHLPSEPLFFHHAQRLIAPYLVGLIAKVTALSVPLVFRVAAFASMTIVILVFERLLRQFPLSQEDYGWCLAMLLLNPYSFRYYGIVPGMLPDLVFVTGLSVLLLGLVQLSPRLVITGMAIATIGRQTAIVLIPGLLLWLWQSKPWQQQPLRPKLITIGLVITTTISLYQFTGNIIRSFTLPDQNLEAVIGLVNWLQHHFSLGTLLDHCLRLLLPLLMAIALLLIQHFNPDKEMISNEVPNPHPNLDASFWACLLMASGIVAQPFLAGPSITGQNASRLAALAILPLLTALVIKLGQKSWLTASRPKLTVKVILTMALVGGSFHHLYTVLSWPNAAVFAAIQVTIVGMVTLLALTQPDDRPLQP